MSTEQLHIKIVGKKNKLYYLCKKIYNFHVCHQFHGHTKLERKFAQLVQLNTRQVIYRKLYLECEFKKLLSK